MKKETKKLIEEHYKNTYKNEINSIFELALIEFIEFHNFKKDQEYDSFLCNIHTNFEDEYKHNCVACNLKYTNDRIEKFMLGYRLYYDVNFAMTGLIMLLYLQVECIFEYLDIIKLPENYKMKEFRTLYKIKRWANFLKHPKTFMLVHHPIWAFEGMEYYENIATGEPIINTDFVQKYYSGDSKNKELFKELHGRKDILVLFPNPLELIKEFCEVQNKFSDLIKDNKIFRDILDDSASLEEKYDIDAEES